MPDTEFGLNRCWCSSFQNLHCHLHEKPNISKSMAIPSIRPHVLLVKGGVRVPMCTNRLCPRFFRIGSLNETPMFISRLFTVCFFVNRVVSSKEASVSSVYIIEFINFQNIQIVVFPSMDHSFRKSSYLFCQAGLPVESLYQKNQSQLNSLCVRHWHSTQKCSLIQICAFLLKFSPLLISSISPNTCWRFNQLFAPVLWQGQRPVFSKSIFLFPHLHNFVQNIPHLMNVVFATINFWPF